jgi:hypothetical protein
MIFELNEKLNAMDIVNHNNKLLDDKYKLFIKTETGVDQRYNKYEPISCYIGNKYLIMSFDNIKGKRDYNFEDFLIRKFNNNDYNLIGCVYYNGGHYCYYDVTKRTWYNDGTVTKEVQMNGKTSNIYDFWFSILLYENSNININHILIYTIITILCEQKYYPNIILKSEEYEKYFIVKDNYIEINNERIKDSLIELVKKLDDPDNNWLKEKLSAEYNYINYKLNEL